MWPFASSLEASHHEPRCHPDGRSDVQKLLDRQRSDLLYVLKLAVNVQLAGTPVGVIEFHSQL